MDFNATDEPIKFMLKTLGSRIDYNELVKRFENELKDIYTIQALAELFAANAFGETIEESLESLKRANEISCMDPGDPGVDPTEFLSVPLNIQAFCSTLNACQKAIEIYDELDLDRIPQTIKNKAHVDANFTISGIIKARLNYVDGFWFFPGVPIYVTNDDETTSLNIKPMSLLNLLDLDEKGYYLSFEGLKCMDEFFNMGVVEKFYSKKKDSLIYEMRERLLDAHESGNVYIPGHCNSDDLWLKADDIGRSALMSVMEEIHKQRGLFMGGKNKIYMGPDDGYQYIRLFLGLVSQDHTGFYVTDNSIGMYLDMHYGDFHDLYHGIE